MIKKISIKVTVIIVLCFVSASLWGDNHNWSNDHDIDARHQRESTYIPDFGPFSDEFGDASREIVALVNQEREARGLHPLIVHTQLSGISRIHSVRMGQKNFYSHTDPDGVTPNERIHRALADRYYLSATSENIAYRQNSNWPDDIDQIALAERFMDGWMNSPGHRENILNPSRTHIGVGLFLEGDTIYATQKFIAYLVRAEDIVHGQQVSRHRSAIRFQLNPQYADNHDLVVRINLPDPDARWPLEDGRFYTGLGFIQPEWLNETDFLVHLPVDHFGTGSYAIRFGNTGGTSTQLDEFSVVVD